ncbi:hypothetical protein [Nonomuraea typhae]|uniref:Uncharacterized protein n=1 Tax=Nonomuraea typhae TaxID=2603600 RepID=A0ABW7YX09_9ACTN
MDESVFAKIANAVENIEIADARADTPLSRTEFLDLFDLDIGQSVQGCPVRTLYHRYLAVRAYRRLAIMNPTRQ